MNLLELLVFVVTQVVRLDYASHRGLRQVWGLLHAGRVFDT